MKTSQVNIGLINPKDAQNMGSILRAMGCYEGEKVYYTGNRYAYALRHNTDTQKASESIDVIKVDDLVETAKKHLPSETKIVCIELVEGATPLPDFQHPDNAFYIFGPEDGNIGQKIINQADEVVYVPTKGCMNLAATGNVVLYDRMAKSQLGQRLIEQGDDLIKASRDGNNYLKCKNR